jgi:YfiR/HmsC-like
MLLIRALLMAGVCVSNAPAAVPTPQEYISGFVLYVRWPGDVTIKAWQICVGANADSSSDAHYINLLVRDRPFEIRHVKPGEALGSCHILDLTGTDASTTVALLKAAQGANGLLIVGNGRDFCSAGGLICLHSQDPRGGFEVNLSAVKNAGFLINAKLLMMARQTEAGGAP